MVFCVSVVCVVSVVSDLFDLFVVPALFVVSVLFQCLFHSSHCCIIYLLLYDISLVCYSRVRGSVPYYEWIDR